MMKQSLITLIFLVLVSSIAIAQKTQYKVGCIGFYNFENLFDTIDAPDVRDEEFTPSGGRNWNYELYTDKLNKLAKVVSELGTELTPDGISILGVSEVENKGVLEDFVKNPQLAKRKYQIVHYDSPDKRGIDVALLYQAKYFKVTGSQAIPLLIYDDKKERKYTRDILLVSGEYDGDLMHIMVNHWPSRSGGESASRAYRNAAAMVCKQVSDSLMTVNPEAKIIIMGDLNDDPSSPSVKKVLAAKGKKGSVKQNGFYNPMVSYFKKGIGTLAYRDSWNLFDQILVSEGLLDNQNKAYAYYKTEIHNRPYLIQKNGQYKGYPFRTFSGNAYLGGYSDHLPVYVYLIKALEN